jgi:hypothetical protein
MTRHDKSHTMRHLGHLKFGTTLFLLDSGGNARRVPLLISGVDISGAS